MKTCLTTFDKKPSERLEFWQEVVCRKYVSASAVSEVAGDEFQASLTSRDLGPLVVAEMGAPLHFWSRKPVHVRNDGQEVYIVSRLRRGGGELTQFGRTVRLGDGDLVIYDSGAPFEYALRADTQLIKIPKPLLNAKLGSPRDLMAVNVDHGNPLSPVLGDLLTGALEIDLAQDAHSAVARRLSSAIVDLLVSICDLRRDAAPAAGDRARLDKVMRFARAHLDSEGLTPETLAKAGAISMRTLNRLFATLGTTPMRWVWSQRLEASRISLSDGCAASVTEAAFAHGFRELAHFSRSFKKAFGVTPQQMLRK